MVSLENILAFKNFLKEIKCENYDFREKKIYINPKEKINYLFNTSIKGIEESDLIVLIGCNPRHEATMVNARIRKAFKQNKTEIFSIGDPGNLTYDYNLLTNEISDLEDILNKKNDFYKKIILSKKHMILAGRK